MKSSTSASLALSDDLGEGIPRELLTQLSPSERKDAEELLRLLEERDRRQSRNKIKQLFPDTGPFRRELYAKHLEFFQLGAEFNERAFVAANRVGKTVAAAYELTVHLTGLYPSWWVGRRFVDPVQAWAAGDTAKTTRDIIQASLLGPPGDAHAEGTGMIPGDLIDHTTPKHGLPDAVETIYVKHVSGGLSVLQLKSYDQGRVAFQGASIDVGWLDEECDEAIYVEVLTRTLTTNGLVMLTFTPLEGLTKLVLSFLPAMAPRAV
jgi:phage terminase large subunit-like protein